MGDSSPHSPGLRLHWEFKQDTVPRAKRLLDSAAQLQALQSAKRVRVLSRVCSTPKPSENLLLLSPGSPCSHFLDDSGQGDLAASFCGSQYDDVAISLDTSRCFDDTELDDSLLELSGSEKGNSPFDYTEEEIQEILADDCTEAEQHLIRKSHLSQSVNEESGQAGSSSCSGASVSEDASEIAEEPEAPLPQEHSPVSSGCYPGFLSGSAGLGGIHLQQDLDLQDLLRLSPFAVGGSDEPLEGNYVVEVEREALEAMIDDCLGYATTAGSCILEESLEPKGQEGLALDCLGRAVPLSHLGDESPAPGSGNKELPKATGSLFSRKSDSPEDGEGESPGAEQPSGDIKLSGTAIVQTVQEETTSGKKPGKVIIAPQEKEKRLKQRPCISGVKVEQKKRFYPECAHPHDEKGTPYSRNYPRSNKKPTQRYSHTHWVSKNLAKLHDFQSIPDHFQCNPV
ncbi:S100P-binding protein-like isoform X2 [Neopelma chrysocephalum]|uniref:S100P-binding protein-like isoform X2 n=1 Tax=Neopelma chrysocephalum TaxID=114329 RepID=UPI000FCD41B0|nr:S100P-binding protein-like isoform X2 [Neopelma chrysocephalum]